jgi:hypothetical protein
MDSPCHLCGRIQHHPRAIAMSPLFDVHIRVVNQRPDRRVFHGIRIIDMSTYPPCLREDQPAVHWSREIIPKSPTPIMTRFRAGVFSHHHAQQGPFHRIPPTKTSG